MNNEDILSKLVLPHKTIEELQKMFGLSYGEGLHLRNAIMNDYDLMLGIKYKEVS